MEDHYLWATVVRLDATRKGGAWMDIAPLQLYNRIFPVQAVIFPLINKWEGDFIPLQGKRGGGGCECEM
jgi:hypothetical protein